MTDETAAPASTWHDVGDLSEVERRRRTVVSVGDDEIVVVAHEGRLFALDNVCIHRQRELNKGVVLRDRLVCPGHQWAFALDTGWEATKQQCQPVYSVRVTDAGRVEVDLASRRIIPAPVEQPQ